MATIEQCEQAFDRLAGRLAAVDAAQRRHGLDRTLCCTVSDLDVSYSGRLKDGLLLGITQREDPRAKVRLVLTSDDLLALVDGGLNLAPAWATGRIKVKASALDLVRLKSIF